MFYINYKYSKKEVKRLIGLPDHIVNSNSTYYDYGYPEYMGVFYFYVNLDGPGTTGHDYPNKINQDNTLFWTAPQNTHIKQKKMSQIISDKYDKLLFIRYSNKEKFIYMGKLIFKDLVQEQYPVIIKFNILCENYLFDVKYYIDANNEFEEKILNYYKINNNKLYKDIKLNPKFPIIRSVFTNYYYRSSSVSTFVKNRAKGFCELCKMPAPFIKTDGTPYLETHHIVKLSNMGVDKIYNCVALCPNCHRELHYGQLSIEKEKELVEILYKSLINDKNLNQEDYAQFIMYHNYKVMK